MTLRPSTATNVEGRIERERERGREEERTERAEEIGGSGEGIEVVGGLVVRVAVVASVVEGRKGLFLKLWEGVEREL